MLYAWMGFLKPGAAPVPQGLQQEAGGFLGQSFLKVHFAGPLRDVSGERQGMMMIFEHDTRDGAESFVSSSPYLRAGLYEDYRLYEYDNEVG